jgi:hypothetical protein
VIGADAFPEKLWQIVSPDRLWRLMGSRMRSTTVSSASSRTTSLLNLEMTGRTPIDGSTDIYAICDVIKYFFRSLPEPVVPSTVYFAFIDSASRFQLLFVPVINSPHIVFQKSKVSSLAWQTSGASSGSYPPRILIF